MRWPGSCSESAISNTPMRGKAHEAEVYPPELCKAILRGVRRHLKPMSRFESEDVQEVFVGETDVGNIEELLDREVHNAGMEVRGSDGMAAEEGSEESSEKVWSRGHDVLRHRRPV